MSLIEAQKYFILHAPRQTGKTSAILALAAELNAAGRYRAVYVDVEGGQSARNDVFSCVQAILSMITRAARRVGDMYPGEIRAEVLALGAHDALNEMLTRWCEHSTLPICLFIDEIDALIGDSLISVLRQLRSGYESRPNHFPHSLILCGVRDVRDYRIHGTNEIITGGSAFNIKSESLRLGDFSQDEVRELYGQHTAETGQVFEEAVFPLVWELTRGQPWLVNALAEQACFKLQKDRSKPITVDLILQGKENLIVNRVTHLDHLTETLKESRVQRVIEPLVAAQGQMSEDLANSDDAQYLIDLGLIRLEPSGLAIANGMYREVIPRVLNFQMQTNFMHLERTAWYVGTDGRLDMPKMMRAFQQFFRENSETWLERYEYKEAGPHLVLQAFLQRIINGGGRIDREYGLGRLRTDLLIQWDYPGGVQRVVIELKVLRGTLEKTIEQGLLQIAEYMDRTGADDAHLVIFDRRADISWDNKVFERQAATANGRPVWIWGM